jgi:hypothetical protein
VLTRDESAGVTAVVIFAKLIKEVWKRDLAGNTKEKEKVFTAKAKWVSKKIEEYVEESGEEHDDGTEGLYRIKKKRYRKWEKDFDILQTII